MKISLSWICNYIDSSLSSIDVDKLVSLFNTHTAEIEHFEKNTIQLKTIFIVQVVQILSEKIIVHCKELNKDIQLSNRSDIVKSKYYLINEFNNSYCWTTLCHFQSDKEGLFPAISIKANTLDGSWRKQITETDYILDVDNKSINHRPDLWGHYGIAREIAAILNIKLKPLSKNLSKQPVINFDNISKKNNNDSFTISIQDENCSRFSGLYCDKFTNKDSDLSIAIALIRVGAKPINGIIDITNYVMFDIGRPMHVFDAKSFESKNIIIRKAKNNEKLIILDGQNLQLTSQDLVIANDKVPVSLAGIVGGKDSGFNEQTTSIVLEAAGFHPTTIRLTAQHFKLRTEASARFEKNLDPMQNITALQRFLYIAKQCGIIKKINYPIISAGKDIIKKSINISHQFIEKRIGSQIDKNFIINTLQKLGFKIQAKKNKHDIIYNILIPTTRMTKDINITEDILEEIIRMYGYDKIELKPIMRQSQPFDTKSIRNISNIKKHLAFSCNMHEIRDYLFFDEDFLSRINFNPLNTINVKNPESKNSTRLITSLVPNLIKNIEANITKQDQLRFFEWNNIWNNKNNTFNETSSLAGIMFDKKAIDFYNMKNELQGLFNLLNITVAWTKPKSEIDPWYDIHKTTELFIDTKKIGTAGILSQQFLKPIIEGQAFAFELDGEFLKSISQKKQLFQPWSKYQDVLYDISLLVPLTITSDQIKNSIKSSSEKIINVSLIDFFEKQEWSQHRALTFRYTISDSSKTLDKKDIDDVVVKVQTSLEKYKVQIR